MMGRHCIRIVFALLWLPQSAAAQVRERVGTEGAADTTIAVSLSAAFRAAAERTLPAVVFIAVEQTVLPQGGELDGLPRGIPEFFGFPGMPGMPEMDPRPRQGSGSGFIIDAQGHILTNAHVVADASRLTVRTIDGREYSATVVGSDPSSDIAVIRIEPRPGEKLPVAPLGDSQPLRVGDWVLALGNPLGLDFSVTAGIVSAKGRQMVGGSPSDLQSFIQTDAAINPGNSGGPLIDLFGRVVGVNSAIFGSDRFVGYGFAVPIGLARRVVADLLEYGHLRRPRVGIQVRAVRAVEAEAFGMDEVRGAFIAAAVPGDPAATAGIRAGDIVVSLNREPIRDNTELITGLAEQRPGEIATFGVFRDGRVLEFDVRLAEFEQPATEQAAPEQGTLEQTEQVLGFNVTDITPDLAQRLRYRGEGGVLVTRISPYGSAGSEGVRANMVVLAINGQRVNSAEQVQEIAAGIDPGSAVSLTVYNPDVGGEMIMVYRTRQ
ncbi:MAG: trypsin-like peptidase domain-containing protein [Gemmatimonadota bacterium]